MFSMASCSVSTRIVVQYNHSTNGLDDSWRSNSFKFALRSYSRFSAHKLDFSNQSVDCFLTKNGPINLGPTFNVRLTNFSLIISVNWIWNLSKTIKRNALPILSCLIVISFLCFINILKTKRYKCP